MIHLLHTSGRALIVRVKRMSAPTVFRRRMVSTAAVTAVAAVSVYLIGLASEFPEPAGERTPTDTTTSAAAICVFSGNQNEIHC